MGANKIIIDGYNYIWAIQSEYPISRSNLQREREKLISTLNSYYIKKQIPITVVFDGGKGGVGFETNDYIQNISIIYSRLGETADEVIMRIVKKEKSAAIVVTSDNEIIRYAIKKGAAVIKCREFEKKILTTALSSKFEDEEWFKKDEDDDDPYDQPITTKKKGNPKKRPRIERQMKKRLKKL